MRSTANDLLRFLQAAQGRRETSLAPAFATLLDVRRQTDRSGLYAAAGWFLETMHADELVIKSDGTGGYTGFIGYSARTGIAALPLSNTAGGDRTMHLGRHLINAAFPVPALHTQIAIDPATFAAYTGCYALTPQFIITVTARDGRLMVLATGQREHEVFAEGTARFFLRSVDAQITFELGPDGQIRALILHQNGRDQRAARIP